MMIATADDDDSRNNFNKVDDNDNDDNNDYNDNDDNNDYNQIASAIRHPLAQFQKVFTHLEKNVKAVFLLSFKKKHITVVFI